MKWKSCTKFHIHALNQEKLLSELCKYVSLFDIERKSKDDTTFKCSYLDHKKVQKFLKKRNINVQSVEHEGLLYRCARLLTCYGAVAAIIVFFALYFVQSQFLLQYEVLGADKLSEEEIVCFVKDNFSRSKMSLNPKDVEVGLMDKFNRISFASCIMKGQTLVINIKEKLMPEEMYGSFSPLVAQKNGRITEINLISGTLKVKVGDIVQKGDVLVEPFTLDTSGQLKKVEAQAEILADVYNEGSVDHYDTYIEVKRTGRVAVKNDITLFGLSIYNFQEDFDFKMYEVEFEEVNLIRNLLLPFKMRKTYIYELEQNVIETKFEDVEQEFVQKAKQKALENCENYDKMKEEFYTIRSFSGVTIVNFCIITQEQIQTYAN